MTSLALKERSLSDVMVKIAIDRAVRVEERVIKIFKKKSTKEKEEVLRHIGLLGGAGLNSKLYKVLENIYLLSIVKNEN